MADDSAGTTISFGTTGYAPNLISVGGPGASRAAIDSTHMASTAMEYIEASLVEGGEVTLEVEYLPNQSVPIATVPETITINWGGLGTSTSFLGFCTAFEPNAPGVGQKMTATMTLKLTGLITQL